MKPGSSTRESPSPTNGLGGNIDNCRCSCFTDTHHPLWQSPTPTGSRGSCCSFCQPSTQPPLVWTLLCTRSLFHWGWGMGVVLLLNWWFLLLVNLIVLWFSPYVGKKMGVVVVVVVVVVMRVYLQLWLRLLCQCDYFMTVGKFSRLLEGVFRDNCVFSLAGFGWAGQYFFWGTVVCFRRGVWVGTAFWGMVVCFQ